MRPAVARMNYYNIGANQIILAGRAIYNALRDAKAGISENGKRDLLWSMGISGDNPIMLVHCPAQFSSESLKSVISAYRYICFAGCKMDLLVLDFSEQDYMQADYNRVENLLASIERGENEVVHHKCRYESPDMLQALKSMSCIYIDLAHSEQNERSQGPEPEKLEIVPSDYPPSKITAQSLELFNGLGGFNEDGREYVILIRRGRGTLLPWSNVISTGNLGTVVCENGGGYTWHANSGLEKLTDFQNDPVINIPNEYIYIRDEENGRFWTITSSPINLGDEYKAVHGQGYEHMHVLYRTGP